MSTPEFPNYQQEVTFPIDNTNAVQNPRGIPFVDNKYHKPLYKLMGKMMKPKAKPKSHAPKVRSGRKGKKKVAFH